MLSSFYITKGMWLHVEGANTPNYDSNGYVTGLDRTGTMLNDMRSFLDFAKSKNLFVIFALWNGALLRDSRTKNLFWDDSKLQSYIDKALKVAAEHIFKKLFPKHTVVISPWSVHWVTILLWLHGKF